ncbi:conserved hypothetical protein [Trichinella spiralis]|uniref:hypothetical protein n=1 Tax=Trichinella spiralis TaxID=6334 RepID=UPI0001EFDC57|nr:conserved hypothetical protein [Trichinella spiralis]
MDTSLKAVPERWEFEHFTRKHWHLQFREPFLYTCLAVTAGAKITRSLPFVESSLELLGELSGFVQRAPPNAWPLDLAPHPSTPLPTAIASLTSCHETPSRHQVVLGGHRDVTHPYRVASVDRSSHEASPFELRSCSLCSQLS